MSINKYLFILIFLVLFNQVVLAQDNFVYESKGKRNPFIPLVSPEGRLLKLDKAEDDPASGSGGVSLEGIIYDKHGRSFAIVNATVVGIGDIVGDYRVLKIQENRVILIKDGQPLEVSLIKREAD
ncbi:MAG: general secretion pathway protein GspB [Candidatus Omnitrophica bacterium]|jgi:hypothetical protein|nr:general secretion pathway protein GspB [Candidatus Omnitrophota bacterium]